MSPTTLTTLSLFNLPTLLSMSSSTCFSLFWFSILLVLLPSVNPKSLKTSGLCSWASIPLIKATLAVDPLSLDNSGKFLRCLSEAIESYTIPWYQNGDAQTYDQPRNNSNRLAMRYRLDASRLPLGEAALVQHVNDLNLNYIMMPSNLTAHCFRTNKTHEAIIHHQVMGTLINSLNDVHGKTVWIVGVVVCILLIPAIMVALLVKQMRRTREAVKHSFCMMEEFAREALPRKFSYQELALATNNFSSERLLGRGGTGLVYKGYLSNSDHVVAVKKICIEYNSAKEVFTTELKIASQLECSNIVALIGWSNDHGEFLLVYDYMSNGSLDKHLFKNGTHLSWKVRCDIALDLAFALLYLHEESGQCVLHRDIKSANVMLDSNFSAKLGDFGVAMFQDPQLGLQSTKVVGTFGYIAPEYYHLGKASKESDIYSFGVVALEVATGRRKHKEESHSHLSLVEWVWQLYGAANILDAADARLNMDFDAREMECLLIVGLWCAHPIDKQRPSARQAIQVLKFEAPLPHLPNEMPSLINNVTPSPVPSNPPSISMSLEFGR